MFRKTNVEISQIYHGTVLKVTNTIGNAIKIGIEVTTH